MATRPQILRLAIPLANREEDSSRGGAIPREAALEVLSASTAPAALPAAGDGASRTRDFALSSGFAYRRAARGSFDPPSR